MLFSLLLGHCEFITHKLNQFLVNLFLKFLSFIIPLFKLNIHVNFIYPNIQFLVASFSPIDNLFWDHGQPLGHMNSPSFNVHNPPKWVSNWSLNTRRKAFWVLEVRRAKASAFRTSQLQTQSTKNS